MKPLNAKIINRTFVLNERKTKCIIKWIDPNYNNVCKSVGVSICSKEDKYSEIKGKHIAEARARIDMYHRIIKYSNDYYVDMCDKHRNCLCLERDNLDKLLYDKE